MEPFGELQPVEGLEAGYFVFQQVFDLIGLQVADEMIFVGIACSASYFSFSSCTLFSAIKV